MSWPAGQISVHAQAELARWQALAEEWPMTKDDLMLRCDACGQCAVRTHDQLGRPYELLTADGALVQVVAHLRQCHPGALDG